jgi:hypothetical protein
MFLFQEFQTESSIFANFYNQLKILFVVVSPFVKRSPNVSGHHLLTTLFLLTD